MSYTSAMTRKSPGSIWLFQAFGIDVFLHVSWFLIVAIEYQYAAQHSLFHNPLWNLAVYVGLFAIVTMHEFGHALACRSVGGDAKRIILWPLGGIAFVAPPQRPGPVLWSIAAGPLVNVALVPVTIALVFLFQVPLMQGPLTDVQQFVLIMASINIVLLVFNLLPIYPLDGGQILQAILWFFIGRSKSLSITSVVGIGGAGCGGSVALWTTRWILLAIAVFVCYQAFNGFRIARQMAAMETAEEDRARHITGVDQRRM